MIPCALTIAGSDTGGGAGVQADLKTFAALGVHGLSAFTALTAQSTVEVRGIHAVPPSFVRLQVETVLDDFSVRYAKTGMLFSGEIIDVVADVVAERRLEVVVDPVMIAESGATLLSSDAVAILKSRLLPKACLVTPNLPELELLTGMAAESLEEMRDAGRQLLDQGARAVLVKGGHRRGAPVDVFLEGREVVCLEGERLDTVSTHGTGCTYAAAITALLARGEPLVEAVRRAHGYLRDAIAAGPVRPLLGRGRGPVHHFHAFYAWPRGFA